jgi:hypothetical protein
MVFSRSSLLDSRASAPETANQPELLGGNFDPHPTVMIS